MCKMGNTDTNHPQTTYPSLLQTTTTTTLNQAGERAFIPATPRSTLRCLRGTCVCARVRAYTETINVPSSCHGLEYQVCLSSSHYCCCAVWCVLCPVSCLADAGGLVAVVRGNDAGAPRYPIPYPIIPLKPPGALDLSLGSAALSHTIPHHHHPSSQRRIGTWSIGESYLNRAGTTR